MDKNLSVLQEAFEGMCPGDRRILQAYMVAALAKKVGEREWKEALSTARRHLRMRGGRRLPSDLDQEGAA